MSDLDRFPIYQNYTRTYGGRSGDTKRPLGAWRPMRYCEDDWILCAWVDRTSRTRFDVGLFLAEDHELFIKDAGVMGGLVFMLSDAYQKLGAMELHFVGPPEGHEAEVPASIRRVASTLGVRLSHRRTIDDAEGRDLYARLTGLSAETVELARKRGIDITRVCFVIQRRIWSREQIEYLCEHTAAPERLFDGGALAEHRISYTHDLLYMRLALLAERVKTLLETTSKEAPAITMRWVTPSTVEFRGVPASELGRSAENFREGEPFTVHLWPRNEFEYTTGLPRELQALIRSGSRSAIAVTQDCARIPQAVRTILDAPGATPVLMVVDTLSDLDLEIQQRLARATSTRRPLPERPD